MKYLLKILFLLLTWFTQLCATPAFTKVVLPSYELTFSKSENVKEEITVKIGVENFARIGISEKSHPLNATSLENYVLEESRARMSGEVVQGAGNLISKLDNLGLTALKTEINLLDDVTKAKFLDEFAGASDDALRAMNGNTSLVNYWKTNSSLIKGKSYPNVGHKGWDDTKNAIISSGNTVDNKILTAVDNAAPPSNSQIAVAGAYSPELGGNVTLRYNNSSFNAASLEPELKLHLDYLKVIKNDFDAGGSLYQKLYSNVPLEKIQNAGLVGTHAEVLAVNEVIVQLKAAGKFNGIQDLNKIHVLVKGRAAFGNMCRCPHCFHILDGVKMIGNQ